MKDYNKHYVDLLEKLKDISGVNSKESELLKRLSHFIFVDTNNKVIVNLMENDEQLKKLVISIDNEIGKIKATLSSSQNNIDRLALKDKLNSYIELKNNLISFCEAQSIPLDEVYSLIEDTYESLKNSCSGNVKLFNEPLVKIVNQNGKRFLINDEAIHSTYQMIQDKDFMNEVCEGVRLVQDEAKAKEEYDFCNEVLSYQELLYNNASSIIDFNTYRIMKERYQKKLYNNSDDNIDSRIRTIQNRISREFDTVIRGFYNKKLEMLKAELNHLMMKKQRIAEIKRNLRIVTNRIHSIYEELCDNGLGVLLFEAYSMNHSEDDLDLSNCIRNLNSFNDLDDYFNNINRMRIEDNKKLNAIEKDKQDYISRCGIHTLDFISRNYETACFLTDVMKSSEESEVSPKLALFILEIISQAKLENSRDIDLSDQDYENLENWYDDNVKSCFNDYEEEFYGIYYDLNKKVKKNDVNCY